LVIDLSAVTFLDSSGIRVLVHAYQALNEAGGSLRVRGATGVVRRALEIVGLDGVLALE
jgi:stage II sporulation protein AA (anti-sigma F factor antagonist)